MNGVTDGYLQWLGLVDPADDDPPIGPTGEECPFCAAGIEYDGRVLYCDRCEVVWHDGDELAADRANGGALDEYQHRMP